MARPRKPTEAKIAAGNPGKRALPTSEPPRVHGVVMPPSGMPGPVLVLWRRFAGLLKARGQLSLDTAEALEQLAYCAQEVRELREQIKTEGRTVTQTTVTGESMIRANPAQAMFSDADRRLRGWLAEFGLTDATRSKVAAGDPTPKADNPLAEFGLN